MNKFDLKIWWWSFKDDFPGYFWTGIILACISFVVYKCNHTPRPPVNQGIYCAQIIYYNSEEKDIDTTYEEVVMYGDKIKKISAPDGNEYTNRDFISNEEVLIDNTPANDITLSNGLRLKVIPLDKGYCQTKKIMDSIRQTYEEEPNNDNQ